MNPKAVREAIKDFARDWTPYQGAGAGHEVKAVRRVRSAEGLERCCACSGYDPQSGPIFCGDLADVVADVVSLEGCVVAYCERHRARMQAHRVED